MGFAAGLLATIGTVLFGVLCIFLATLASTEILAIVLGLAPLLGLHFVAAMILMGYYNSHKREAEATLKVEEATEQLVAA